MREAREECGLDVRLDGLVNIYSYAGRAPVIVVYAATALGGRLRGDEESLETAAVEPAAIPWDELAFRSTREALRDYLAGLLHPLARPVETVSRGSTGPSRRALRPSSRRR